MTVHLRTSNSCLPNPVKAGERYWLNTASSPVGLRQFAHLSPPRLAISRVFRAAIGPSARDIPGKSYTERRAFWAANPPSSCGKYDIWSSNARVARALADQVEDVLGPERDLLTITAYDVLSMWTSEVVRMNAVRQVGVLLSVCRWAEKQYAVSHGYHGLRLPHGWRRRIAAACATPESRTRGGQRYSAAETGRLWQVLYSRDALVHPLLRDAVLLGGEQRLGQVLLTTTDDVGKVGGSWVFRPPQSGNKLTSWIIVPASLTERFEAIVTAASTRPDGRLFPCSSSTLAKAWHSLERQANVPHLGWFALRRSMVDICADVFWDLIRDSTHPLACPETIVLDAISSHAPQIKRPWRISESPVGLNRVPPQSSATWGILVSAMRVVQRARELAMECASCPTHAEGNS